MKSELLIISPQMAKEMLLHNKTNRKIVQGRVDFYARQMKKGEWQATPEGISFYENGDLRDGQHRLRAIVAAGIPVQMYVTTGVPNESFIVDRGTPRSITAILKIAGRNSVTGKTCCGAINFLFTQAFNRRRPSDSTIIAFADKYGEDISLAGSIANLGANHPIGSKSPVTAAIFCAMKDGVDEKVLRKFARSLNTGFYDNPSETSAIVLRSMIMKLAGGTGGLTSQWKIFVITCKAIRDFSMCIPRTNAYSDSGVVPFWNHTKAYVLAEFE